MGENKPSLDVCVIITLILNIQIIKIIKPTISNFFFSPFSVITGSAFVSGVCLIKYIDNNVNTIETMKMVLQPKCVDIKPPKSVQIPLPPHDPIDQ